MNSNPSSVAMNEPIVVVCAADNNYSMPLAVTIRSALENLNSSRKLLWFIIDGGITQRNKQRILKSLNSKLLTSGQCEVRWIPRPEIFDEKVALSDTLPSSQSLPNSTFYRIVISDLLPKQLKKAIYIDCDLVVNESLEKLWDIDIKDNYLLATTSHRPKMGTENAFSYTVTHPEGGLLNWQELGFSADDKRFSAGVLVLNLEKWRADNMCANALNYLAHNQQYIRWHDADILQGIVRRQWGELDRRWNRVAAKYLTQEDVDKAFVVHFTSAEKPWVAIEWNPASDLFFHYLAMTDWSRYRHTIPQRIWRRIKRETKHILKFS